MKKRKKRMVGKSTRRILDGSGASLVEIKNSTSLPLFNGLGKLPITAKNKSMIERTKNKYDTCTKTSMVLVLKKITQISAPT